MRELLTATETAKVLGLKTSTQVYKIVDFFDSNHEDEWELIEGDHFEFQRMSGGKPKRVFYEEGVEALAEYLDKDTPRIIKALSEIITKKRRKRKQLLVSRRITQELIEAGSLVEVRGELGFVSQRTCTSILQTNGKGINNSINRLKKGGLLEGQEGIELDKHFIKTEQNNLIWSQKGIASIAIDMSQNSKISKSRKAWVNAVGSVVEDCFKAEIKRLKAAPKRIEKAIVSAKRAANHTCQVTGKRATRSNSLPLDGHHLFDKATRPDLEDLHENILVVQSEIHSEFHRWIGGKSCEPKDFLRFVSEVRGDLFDSVSDSSMQRFNSLTARLSTLQKNYENNHLHYRKL